MQQRGVCAVPFFFGTAAGRRPAVRCARPPTGLQGPCRRLIFRTKGVYTVAAASRRKPGTSRAVAAGSQLQGGGRTTAAVCRAARTLPSYRAAPLAPAYLHHPAQRNDPLARPRNRRTRPSRSVPSLTKVANAPNALAVGRPPSRRWTQRFAPPRRLPGRVSRGTNRDCDTGMGLWVRANILPHARSILFLPPCQTRNGALSRNRSPSKRLGPAIIETLGDFPVWQFQSCTRLDRVRTRGADGFSRTVAFLALNLHRIVIATTGAATTCSYSSQLFRSISRNRLSMPELLKFRPPDIVRF